MADNVRQSLENQQFQVIVIGGGINGVAIARESARAADPGRGDERRLRAPRRPLGFGHLDRKRGLLPNIPEVQLLDGRDLLAAAFRTEFAGLALQ